jgi:chloride channel 7
VFEPLDRQKRLHPYRSSIKLWLAFGLIGVAVAIAGFLMTEMEIFLIAVKGETFQYLVHNDSVGKGHEVSAMLFFILISLVLATSAGMLTVYVGPKAAGSGIPELIGCMNGINISSYLTPVILMVKSVAVVLAVAGTLVLGREGPLAHVGACIGILVLFLPMRFLGFDEFKTNEKYREFVAAGLSAGVSVAFGAPMGGTLFGYEIAGAQTFWSFEMIWRNFFCCAIATFGLAALYSL